MRLRTATFMTAGGLALSAGSGFTASNTFSNTTNIVGYGDDVATGATVTAVVYTHLSTDASKLASVVFTTTTNITGKTATMQLRDTATTVLGTPYTCSLGTYSAGSMSVTCATASNPAIASVYAVGLDVHE